ncbi:sodium/glutamate symporter, partial [Acidaminococcus intestini]|uniref:sodium/glutamate symporter n=1 Tax=Acidaminococcus intestini TaxID=187327 RepID=UPI00307D0C4B
MGGLAIKLDMFQSLALAVIAIWLGNWCRQKFPFLRKYCLPGAVVGGTIISLISLVLYETGVAELSFDEMYPLYWTPSKEGTFCV